MATQTSSPPASPNARANYAVDERSFGNGSAREISPGYPSPPASPPHTGSTKGSMGPPASGARAQAGYASMTGAGAALAQQGGSTTHPPSKSATGGQSHAHRPVSAMPTPSSRHVVPPSPASRQAANSGSDVLASMNAGASYNERRASAHPTMTSSQTTANAGAMPAVPSGVDSQVAANAISSGIPITSPAALSYFAAHPRRQQVHFGSYLLLQTLGEGEFGKVKLGVHKEWGEEVAVKLIKRDKVATPDARLALNEPKDPSKMSKVEREIQVLKDVRHPNIVRLYEVIESDRYIGIVLEYASGGELFDHILAHKYLKERDACRLFAQLISGVSYLHQKKIVHRDLKLENLLLDRNRNVIITDFGFANNFEDRRDDLMATSCGSPCYAAPELVVQDGLYAGSAVDVWSCGVILYAMLAGYLPFDDDPANPDGDNINLLYKYIMATPLSFPEYITAEPRDLLSKMLVPDPQRRIDLVGVMAHSWLAPYRDLFKFSVDELERAAIEQQSKKRQVYRQQMQVQQQLQEQQRSQGAARSSGRSGGDASARGGAAAQAGTTDAHVKAQRHQSAVVSSATSTERWQESAPSTSGRSRPVTGVPQPINAPPVPVLPAMTLAPQPEFTSQLGGDASHTSASYRSSVGGGSTRKREAETTPPSAKKTPSAQKSQRHTIQLEYDESSRQGAAQRGSAAAAPPVPRVERQSSGPAPEPVVVPAVPVVVPAAERKTSASMGRSSTGPPQVTSAPIVETRTPATPTAGSADTSAPPSAFRQPSASPGAQRSSSTRVASNPPPASQQSEDVAFPLPGDRTASGGAGPKPDANSRAPKVPSSVERANSRHRKGLSTDKFFSRLLGSNNAADSAPAAGADAALSPSPSTPGDESKSSTGRRKTMSLVVGGRGDASSVASRDREKAQQAAASKAAKEERRLTGRARKDTLQRPETPRQQTASSVASQASPGTVNGSVRTKASRRQNGLFDEGVNESTSTVGPSSNAAKKVMDWFRKKSLSRGNFSEQPPLGPFERPSQAGSVASRAPSTVADGAEAPRVVVTGANGASAVPAGELESMPSSRSTSGTHSQTSQATDTTGVTSYEGSDIGGIKSIGASTVQLEQQTTPTASSTRVNGLPSPSTPTTGLPPTLAPASPNAASRPFTDASLRYHLGAVDQSALTSRPPREVFAEVRKVLFEMGVEARKEKEEEFKLECVRRKRAKTLMGATQGIGMSIRTSVFPPTQADYERSARSPVTPDGSATPSGPGGSIRNFLRRGSAQPTNTLSTNASTGRPGTAVSGEDAAALPPTLYGDASVDPGHEVRFTVEVTQIKNLPGLYSVDIRRLKGGIWAYKFIYHALLERCQLAAATSATPRASAAA